MRRNLSLKQRAIGFGLLIAGLVFNLAGAPLFAVPFLAAATIYFAWLLWFRKPAND